MSRTSSPGTYSRNSSKSMPRPLKWLRYAPTMVSLTRRLVLVSTRRTVWSNSERVIAGKKSFSSSYSSSCSMCSRNRHRIKDLLNDRIRRHRLGLGFIGQNDSMPQDIGPNTLYIFRRDKGPALQQGPRPRRERQKNRGPRGRAKLNKMFQVQFVFLRLAGRKHEVNDIIAHLVLHMNLID